MNRLIIGILVLNFSIFLSCSNKTRESQNFGEGLTGFVRVDGRTFRDAMNRELILNGINLIVKDPASELGQKLFGWRKAFEVLCSLHQVSPGDAALHFALSHPAIVSIALNTSKPDKMNRNVEILNKTIAESFWKAMKEEELMDPDYRYL